jgi:hypothetical protein
VVGLRVLAVKAEPSELAPPGDGSAPDRATLGTLIAHPDLAADAARRVTVLHVGCTPSPDPSVPSLCTAISELASPQDLLAFVDLEAACTDPGLGSPGAITFSGLESCGQAGCEPFAVRRDPGDAGSTVELPTPAYQLPAALDLSVLPDGHPTRVLGLEAVDLALALDAAPAELAPIAAVTTGCQALAAVAARFGEAWEARPHVAALKRIRVRGPDAVNDPNQNPAVLGIALAGSPLPALGEAPAAVTGGAKLGLLPLHPGNPDDLRERYVEVDAEGVPVRELTEEWTWAWFTSAGELEDPYTRDPEEAAELTAPRTGRAAVWLVLRDLRGGVAWTAGGLEAGP